MNAAGDGPALIEARRFLHCCYCCSDAGETGRFVSEGLGLVVTMHNTRGRSDGSLLSMNREIESEASFAYDRRGPRTSPAIEIQGWIDPPAEGEPYDAPNHVGMHAIGFAVPRLDAALAVA